MLVIHGEVVIFKNRSVIMKRLSLALLMLATIQVNASDIKDFLRSKPVEFKINGTSTRFIATAGGMLKVTRSKADTVTRVVENGVNAAVPEAGDILKEAVKKLVKMGINIQYPDKLEETISKLQVKGHQVLTGEDIVDCVVEAVYQFVMDPQDGLEGIVKAVTREFTNANVHRGVKKLADDQGLTSDRLVGDGTPAQRVVNTVAKQVVYTATGVVHDTVVDKTLEVLKGHDSVEGDLNDLAA